MPYRTYLGSALATTSGTTLVITTTANVFAGDLIVVRVASDNLTATTPTFTATDTAGHVYTTAVHRAHNASPAAGAAAAILVTRATTPMASGSTITVTLSGAVAHRAAFAESFTDVTATVRVSAVNSAGPSQTSATTGALTGAQVGDLVLSVVAVENGQPLTADTDTVGGAWSTGLSVQTGTGTSNTFMTVAGQYKFVTTADPQTHNVSWSGAANDYAAGIVALVPGVYVPPIPPTPPGHVEIDGLLFCVPAHGVAVRVEVRTPTQLLDVTDSVVRATWQQGGAYDAAGSPWFNPTPNPCELELVTDDARWDPTTIGAYDLTPLATNVRITLGEEASFGAGVWSTQHKFYGPLIAHTYEPTPGGGAVVQISAADALTNLGDMIVTERGEESPYARLNWLASGVKDLDYGFSSTATAGPSLGRYHPDQGMTRLELMNACALAAGQALMFQPTDVDAPLPHKTIVYDKPQGSFSNPSTCWLAAVDPENGMTLGGGDVPAFGANTRVACLTDIALARQEQGFRTRIRSARMIAPWLFGRNIPGPISALAPGNHLWQSASIYVQAGDRLELHTYSPSPLTWTGGVPTLRALVNPHAPAQTMVQEDAPFGFTGLAHDHRWTYTVPTGFPVGQLAVIGRYIMVPSGTMGIPATYTEDATRLGGTGTEYEVSSSVPNIETTYGQRALTGWRSPIMWETDHYAWIDRALQWVPAPTVYPRLLRVATSPAHPSPGAQQWAVQMWAGQRLALRHYANPASPAGVTVGAWAVNVSTTLTPTEVTVDVECGPTTSGSA